MSEIQDLQERRDVLLKEQSLGNNLKELQLHQGWKVLESILNNMYVAAVKKLINGTISEQHEARARLLVLEELSQKINASIDFGKAAEEELKSERFNLTQFTS